MKQARKVIISCAVTGSVHTPTMSPYLPVTPDEIAESAIGAAAAGAAILHLHARDPQTGRPSAAPDIFMQFLPRIAAATNAVVNITTGGAHGMSMDDRLAAPRRAAPELCSLNMGSLNFGLFDMAAKKIEWKHGWEQPFLASSRHGIMSNTFAQIDEVIAEMGDARGARFEFECYDVSHLYNLADFVRRGRLQPPFLIQFIFGILGGIGADPENLIVMKQTADRLFGADYYMSCFAAGRQQMPFLAMSAAMGGMVRVGLEDNLYIARGRLATSNAEQVAKIRRICEELGLEIASPDEARDMLALKGQHATAFLPNRLPSLEQRHLKTP